MNVNYQKFLYFRHCARIAAQGMAQKIMFNYLYKQNNARFLCWAKRTEFKRQRKLRRTPSARLQTISFPHTTESPLWIFIKVSFLRLNDAWKGKIFRRNANARPFYRQSSYPDAKKQICPIFNILLIAGCIKNASRKERLFYKSKAFACSADFSIQAAPKIVTNGKQFFSFAGQHAAKSVFIILCG